MTTYTWKNNSGSYSDNSQWTDDQGNNPSGPPGAGDTAVMAGGDITGSGAAEALDVGGTMTFDATLTVTNLTSTGDVTIDSQTITAETASMNGTLDLLGELDVTGYTAGMYGTLDLTVENGGKLSVTKLTLGNGSTLKIDKGGEIDASGGQNSVPANGPVGVVVNGTASVDGGTLNSSGRLDRGRRIRQWHAGRQKRRHHHVDLWFDRGVFGRYRHSHAGRLRNGMAVERRGSGLHRDRQRRLARSAWWQR
jgi:hypothetical protein